MFDYLQIWEEVEDMLKAGKFKSMWDALEDEAFCQALNTKQQQNYQYAKEKLLEGVKEFMDEYLQPISGDNV